MIPKTGWRLIALVLLLTVCAGWSGHPAAGRSAVPARDRTDENIRAASSPDRSSEVVRDHFSTGQRLAEAITTATGLGISPLLGVCGLGAWRYWHCPEPERGGLAWYCQPWYWAAGLFLVLLFAINTKLGLWIPVLKQPMNLVEQVEGKISFLLGSPVIIGEALRLGRILAGPAAAPAESAAGGSFPGPLALAIPEPAGYLVSFFTVLGLLAVYLAVWLVSHALDGLMLLSPWGGVDLVLRTMKLALLGLLAASHAIHPWLGAALAIPVALISGWLAGWAFRLITMATLFAWDLTTLAHRRHRPEQRLLAFPVRWPGIRKRTCGFLLFQPPDTLIFQYRPWLILPRREKSVPAGSGRLIRRGLLWPALLQAGRPDQFWTLLLFPPRYRHHEAWLASRTGAAGIRDSRLRGGLAAGWRWLKNTAGGGPAPADEEI